VCELIGELAGISETVLLYQGELSAPSQPITRSTTSARSGHAALLKTSLNLHGEPIARTARDALHVFRHSRLRYLQLGPYLTRKEGA
jgi:Carbamoyltransferase C-terminus